MKQHDIIELSIEDMVEDGRAFGRCDGLAVFVSGGCTAMGGAEFAGAVPGDLVTAEITKKNKNSAEAVLKNILKPSPDRIAAECPHFGECGGCTMQELSYDAQLSLKRQQVKARLERLGGLGSPKVNETVGAGALKYYRNKATFAVGPHGEVGFLKGKSHFVIDIEDCMLQSDAAMVCADALRAFIKSRIDESHTSADGGSAAGKKNKAIVKTPFGIKQMIVRTAFGTGKVMVVLESDRKDISDIELLIEMLDDAVYSINEHNTDAEDVSLRMDGLVAGGIEENDNDRIFYTLESVAVIYGNDPKKGRVGKCEILAGRPTITDEFVLSDGGTVRYEVSPQSFFQVNPEQMVKLYDKAAEYSGLVSYDEAKSGEIRGADKANNSETKEGQSITILDLYCGAGTIGIWLLKKLQDASGRARVIGIESVKPAVIDANRNSVINGLVNTRYICGRTEEELPGMMGLTRLYKWNEINERVEREPEIKIENVDIAILDPPRAGCGEPLLAAVAAAQPGRIVYVSCDPGTLARDIKYLTAHGYDFTEATPIDMFPWTSHIETVADLLLRE